MNDWDLWWRNLNLWFAGDPRITENWISKGKKEL